MKFQLLRFHATPHKNSNTAIKLAHLIMFGERKGEKSAAHLNRTIAENKGKCCAKAADTASETVPYGEQKKLLDEQ